MNIQLPKDAKHSRPQHKQDGIPATSVPELELGYHVDEGSDGGESGDGDGVGPFGVGVFGFFVGFVEVLGVEADDCEGEDELEEAEDEVEDEDGGGRG